MSSRFLYSSSYVNSTVALRTTDNRVIAMVAGKHDRYFPYFHDKSEWDNLLLYIDGVGYAHSARDIAQLEVAWPEPSTARIGLAGELVGSDGERCEFEIDLHFAVAQGQVYTPGKLVNLPFVPGMRWQPGYLTLAVEDSRFVAAGRNLPLAGGHGAIERGDLVNFVCRSLAFRYDYLCLANADHCGDVTIDFTVRSLTRRNLLERVVDWLAQRTGSLRLVLTPDACQCREANAISSTRVLVEDRVDLGLAMLDRQLIAVGDGPATGPWGLREIFHPASAVQGNR